jgi:hypothetical protein
VADTDAPWTAQGAEDYADAANESLVDDALVRVQAVYPYDSWRGAELRDIVGLAIQHLSRHARAHE